MKTVTDKMGNRLQNGSRVIVADAPNHRGIIIAIKEEGRDIELMISTSKGATIFVAPENVIHEPSITSRRG
jgi:hypothetical protein